MVDFVRDMKEFNTGTLLDFGCGAGRHSTYLAKYGFNVVAMDISQSALKILTAHCKKENLKNILLTQSDMQSLPFKDESFDVFVSTNVLHHATIWSIKESVNEIFRVMKNDAIGLVTTLSNNDYKYGRGKRVDVDTYVSTEEDERDIVHHFFSKKELEFLFDKFEIYSFEEELIPTTKGNRAHFHLKFRKR